MTVVYVDSVFVLNALMDYLLVLCAARLAGIPLRRRRYLLAGLLGGAYAVAVFLPGLGFLSATPVKLAAGILLALAAYGGEAKLLRLTLLRGTEEKFVERIAVASATAAIVTARSSVALYAHHTVDGAFSSVGEIGRRCDRVAHGKESRPFCPFGLCDGIIGRYGRFRGAAEAVKRQCHGGAANGNSKCE